MNDYLKQCCFFIMIFFIYSLVIGGINAFFLKTEEVGQEAEYLILGDSHLQWAINPALLDSSKNICQSGEPYLISYWKLKEYLKHNRVEHVLLGFSYNNLSGYNDKKFFDNQWSTEMFKRTYAIEQYKQVEDRVQINWRELYKTKFQYFCILPRLKHSRYIGSYLKSQKSDLTHLETTIKKQYYYQDKILGNSDVSSEYLDSIQLLCKSKNIELTLINTPLSQEYKAAIPPRFIKYYDAKKNQMQKQKNVKVLDYAHVPFKEEELLNNDHLNSKGAERFTIMVKNSLQNRNR